MKKCTDLKGYVCPIGIRNRRELMHGKVAVGANGHKRIIQEVHLCSSSYNNERTITRVCIVCVYVYVCVLYVCVLYVYCMCVWVFGCGYVCMCVRMLYVHVHTRADLYAYVCVSTQSPTVAVVR